LNRLHLLKTLAPGFLPLLVFIAADALWGTRVGLVVAVASGLLELALSFAREKVCDRFVLLDTLLIVTMGGVSLLLENDVFFRLKPALIELVFCVILGVSAFSPLNIMLAMSRRYLKGVTFSAEQTRAMTRSMKILFLILVGHVLLTVYAALAMSLAAWGFISGGLFYILFAAFFLAEWLRHRRRPRLVAPAQAADEAEEWCDIVDAEGRVRGRAPRRLCHSRRGFLHPVVHMHVIDAGDRIFLQKRSATKVVQPGKWDTAVGGHVSSGESIESALRREALEELGLERFEALPLARYVWESEVESELVFMFVMRGSPDLRLNDQEMEDGAFWKIRKIKAALGKNVLTPNFEFEFAILLKEFFKEPEKTGR
jgi:isopentenyldiphosphate isomerase/intracellular septation protein A